MKKLGKVCGVVLLSIVILTIVGLFFIPSILYAKNALQLQKNVSSSCLDTVPYSGEVCRKALTSQQSCFLDEGSGPLALSISSLIDQEAGERDVLNLIDGLQPPPTPECREAILPILCHSVFQLCDSDHRLHSVIREDCIRVKQDVCAEQWSQVEAFVPVCEDLPKITKKCPSIDGNSSSRTIVQNDNVSLSDVSRNSSLINCSESFYFDENVTNQCRPICGEFQHPSHVSVVVITRFFVIVNFVACVIMFVLALTIQRRTLLEFPMIFLVYTCIPSFIDAVVLIVGFLSNSRLFCRFRDFLTSLEPGNETPMCRASGFVRSFFILQVVTLTTLHTIFLYYAVAFPFSYRQFKLQKRARYAHIISVVLAVVIPLPGAFVPLWGSYRFVSSPISVCLVQNLHLAFFTQIIPICIMLCISSCLLVLIFWIILQEFVVKKLLAKKKVKKVQSIQLKIVLLVIYYIFIGVAGMTVYADSLTEIPYAERVRNFVECENSGVSECVFEGRLSVPSEIMSTIVIVFLSLLPVVAILFICNSKMFKRKS